MNSALWTELARSPLDHKRGRFLLLPVSLVNLYVLNNPADSAIRARGIRFKTEMN